MGMTLTIRMDEALRTALEVFDLCGATEPRGVTALRERHADTPIDSGAALRE